MAHTCTNIIVHYVFSTKNRIKIIDKNLQDRLYPFMSGIAKRNDMNVIAIGGVEDHVHMLLVIPSICSISKAIQIIKAGSSKWIHDYVPGYKHFGWQRGYGAFSVSSYGMDKLISYIRNQPEYHQKLSFKDEYVALLERFNVEYDPKYLWD